MHGKDENIKKNYWLSFYCQWYVDSHRLSVYILFSVRILDSEPIATLKTGSLLPFIIYCFGLEQTRQDGILEKFWKVQGNKTPFLDSKWEYT